MFARYKWILAVVMVLGTATAGLYLGKSQEGSYLGRLYERRDFTLLDDTGDFFTLSSVPAKTLVLLVFTPDGIPVESVKPVNEFAQHVEDLRKIGIEPLMVSRTNGDVARNFKRATRFPGKLLLDGGGSVGRIAGVWESMDTVSYWGYALVNNRFEVLWMARHEWPLSFEQVKKALSEAR